MPPIRSLAFKCCVYIVAVIFSLNKIMPIYFYCVLKGLIYIIIAALSSR